MTPPSDKPKENKPHRFETINYMFDKGFRLHNFSTSERLLFVALWNQADVRGYCTVSRSRLQKLTGLSDRTVKTGIKKMIELKLLRIAKESTREGQSRTYQMKHFRYKRGRKKPAEGGVMSLPGVG